MSIVKRAVLYVSRKWQQSLIILLVLFVVCISALIGFSVLKASRRAAVNLRRQLGGTFCMDNPANMKSAEFGGQENFSASYYAGEFLDYNVIEEVMKTPGISQYSATAKAVANLKSAAGEYYDLVENEQNYFVSYNSFNPHMAPVHGWTSLDQCSYFANHLLEVTQGKPFTEDGAGQAIISRQLAELNQIEIGDRLTLEWNREVLGFDVPEGKQECVFEIVGLFEICGEQQVNQFTLPRQMLQNWVFVDSHTLMDFMGRYLENMGEKTGYEKVIFSVNDPAEMDSIIKNIRENKDINWDCFKITQENTDYRNAEKALKGMDEGIRIMILVITAAGMGVLVLLTGIWAKSRIYETGILLSVGKSRWGILAQRITETVLITVLAFGISCFWGNMAADKVGNRLLAQANEQNREQTNSHTELRIAADSSDLEPVFAAPEVEELDVSMSADILAAACGLELLVVLLSICAAGIPVMRMEPRAILTKHE